MAGLTKEQKAAKAVEAKAIELSGLTAEGFAALSDDERAGFIKAAASEPDDPPEDDGLIAMTKSGEMLNVHPTCVADHKRLGWIEA